MLYPPSFKPSPFGGGFCHAHTLRKDTRMTQKPIEEIADDAYNAMEHGFRNYFRLHPSPIPLEERVNTAVADLLWSQTLPAGVSEFTRRHLTLEAQTYQAAIDCIEAAEFARCH